MPDSTAFPLVRGNNNDYTLNFTQTMVGDVTLEGQRLTLAELVSSGRAGAMGSTYSFPMPAGAQARLQHNGVTYHVNTVPPGKAVAAKSEADKPFWIYNAASFAVIGTLLVMVHLIPEEELSMNMDEVWMQASQPGQSARPRLWLITAHISDLFFCFS